MLRFYNFSWHTQCTVTPLRLLRNQKPGRKAQSVGHLTRKSEVLSSITGLVTYFRFYFR